nr:TIGR04282 family arsenosugar biosynthesis glycosyltransferase [uncultured Rhodoferax sp.]
MSKMPKPRVAVFAKAPVPGYAKTRLIPKLGAAGAADVQARFIRQTLSTACSISEFETSLWCAPDISAPFFLACAKDFNVQLIEQAGDDLGERMEAAFVALASDISPLVLVGTDCPALTAQHIAGAHAALQQGDDAVFIPTEDGGYALIGLHRSHVTLFSDMPWSTPEVMDQTRQRLRAQGLHWRELTTLWDVDEPADHERWVHWRDAQIR